MFHSFYFRIFNFNGLANWPLDKHSKIFAFVLCFSTAAAKIEYIAQGKISGTSILIIVWLV